MLNEYGYEITFFLGEAQEAKGKEKWAYKQCEAFARKLNAKLRKERKTKGKRRCARNS